MSGLFEAIDEVAERFELGRSDVSDIGLGAGGLGAV
jgi:hypothetical protein